MTEALPNRGQNGKFIRSLDTAQRDAEAARLRMLGVPLREISARLGFKTPSAAWKAIRRAIDAAPAEAGAALRQLEVEKLDGLERLMWATIGKKRHLAQNGKVVLDPETSEPVTDDTPVFHATDKLLRIADRRAKLLGLDAPTRVSTRNDSEMDAEIQSLLDQLAGRAPEIDPDTRE